VSRAGERLDAGRVVVLVAEEGESNCARLGLAAARGTSAFVRGALVRCGRNQSLQLDGAPTGAGFDPAAGRGAQRLAGLGDGLAMVVPWTSSR